MSELEILIDDLQKDLSLKYSVYKRSLPLPGINKVVAQNIESYDEALRFCKTMKLNTKETMDDEGRVTIVYYDILPDNVPLQNIYYNDTNITNKGNDKMIVAKNYFGLE